MNYPEYVKVNEKLYKINTDFRIAIECNEIVSDKTIGDFERTLAIIYKLYGDDGLKDVENYSVLVDKAIQYLSCNKGIDDKDEEPDMDYVEDMDFIEASFQSDYGIDLSNVKMHWWKFFNLLCGLSNSELGNCCILNRIRNIRNYDLSEVKDDKMRNKILKAKEQFALKKYKKENNLTAEQEASMKLFNEQMNL